MHRNERIAQAIETLNTIEQAVTLEAHARLAALHTVPAQEQDAYIRFRVDNVVRIYCASDLASAVGSTASP